MRIGIAVVLVVAGWNLNILRELPAVQSGSSAQHVLAYRFPGQDCGAKIENADTALGNTTGEIWVDRNCGTEWTTPVRLQSHHLLRFKEPGTYTTSGGIFLSAGSGIDCEDPDRVTIRVADRVWINLITAKDRAAVTVRNCGLDGNRAGAPGRTAVILLLHTTDSVIQHNKISNSRLQAIMLAHGSSRNRVIDNVVQHYGIGPLGQGITLFRDASHNVVAGNVVSDGKDGTIAILIDDASDDDRDSRPSSYNVVRGNTIVNAFEGISAEGSSFNQIDRNVVSRAGKYGIVVRTGNPAGVSAVNSDTSVTSNIVVDTRGSGAAISFSGIRLQVNRNLVQSTGASAHNMVLDSEGAGRPSSSILVSSNTVRDSSSTGTGIRIAPSTGTDLTVSSNNVSGVRDHGIYASGKGQRWTISNNSISDPSKSGILIATDSSVDQLTLRGNMIRNPRLEAIVLRAPNLSHAMLRDNFAVDDHPQPRMPCGIYISNGTNVELQHNQIEGAVTGEVCRPAANPSH